MTTTNLTTATEITPKDAFFQDSLNIYGQQNRLSYFTTVAVLAIIATTAYIILYVLALYHNVNFFEFGSTFKVFLSVYLLTILITSSIRRCNAIGISPYWLLLVAFVTFFIFIFLVLVPNNTFKRNQATTA